MATAAGTIDNNNKEIIGVAERSIEIDQMIIPNVATCIIHVFRKKPRPTSGHH